MRDPIEICIIDDQTIFRECVAASLRKQPDLKIVGTFANGESLLSPAPGAGSAQIALLEIRLGSAFAFSLPRLLRETFPALKPIWVTAAEEDYVLYRAQAENLPGWVHKNDTLSELMAAIRTVAAGGRHYSRLIQGMLAASLGSGGHFSRVLSPRQQEVLQILGTGLDLSEIAVQLGLSVETVKAHRRDIMERLHLHSGPQLQAYLIRHGFMPAIPR